MRFIFFITLLLIAITGSSQIARIDSLNKIKVFSDDSTKVNLLNEYSYAYCVISTDSSLKYAEQAMELAKLLKYKIGFARAYINIGRVYYYQDNFVKALEWDILGLKVYEELKDEKGIADCQRNIGNVYLNQKQYPKALEYYEKGLSMYEKLQDKKGIANCLRGIANTYMADKNYSSAKENYSKALQLYQEINDMKNMSTCYSNLGVIYMNTNEPQLALDYQMRGLKIKEKIGDKKGIAIILSSLGGMFADKNDAKKALEYFNRSLEVASEIKSLDLLQRNYASLASLYAKQKDYTKAYENHVFYKAMSDSLFNKETLKNQTQLEMKFEFEKEKQKAELEQQKIDALKAEELFRFKLIGIAAGVGFLLMIFLFVMIYKNYRNKKKANDLLTAQKKEIEEKNSILNQQNEEIKTQRDELETQSKFLMKMGDKVAVQHQKIKEQMVIVNHQKKEIMDSIHYARRIQMAILPPDDFIQKYLKNYFILYKPKDIVSGDFYWIEYIDSRILFAAVDCTGHGVPGAFMSIVGNNGLGRAVRESHKIHPSEILDELDDFVVETLRQTNKTDIKDGMDIALCAYDFTTKMFEFSGANNPIYIIRPKQKEFILQNALVPPSGGNDEFNLFEIKGDKQPIGATDNRRKFLNYSFPVEEGDTYYIFSDGFADQFGGASDKHPDGKKFKYSKLKELLLNNQSLSMSDQKILLNKTIEEWRGNLEQVDDVLVIGVRVF
ncbi:MAG TPA: hypothetical protein DEH02_04415 [Bacteroidales bacterium]|nr:MAG: hypothetical protein A2X01_12850 [Bacteroidetes bacterium GWF2_35_48]HBX50299.1 hypothetical protein [Bacteroidales bacterium]